MRRVEFTITGEDGKSLKSGDFEVIKPMPEEPAVINRLLKIPPPEPPQDLRFAR